jgi:hypothetical protein
MDYTKFISPRAKVTENRQLLIADSLATPGKGQPPVLSLIKTLED